MKEKTTERSSYINTFGFFAFAGVFLAATALFSIVFPNSPLYTPSVLPEGFTLRNYILLIFYAGMYLLVYKSYEPLANSKFLRMALGFFVVLVSLLAMLLGYGFYVQGNSIRAVVFLGLSSYLVAAVFEDMMTRRRKDPYYLTSRADLQLFLAEKRSFLMYFVYIAGAALSIALFASGAWLLIFAGLVMLSLCVLGLLSSSSFVKSLEPHTTFISFATLAVALVYAVILAVMAAEYLYIIAILMIAIIFGIKFLVKQDRKEGFVNLSTEQISVLKYKFETEKVVWLATALVYFFAMKQIDPLHDPVLCSLSAFIAVFLTFVIYHLLPVRFSSRIGVLLEIEFFQIIVLLALLSSGGLQSPFSFLIYLPILTAIWGVQSGWMFAPVITSFITVVMLWWSSKLITGLLPIDPLSNYFDRQAISYLMGTLVLGAMSGLLLKSREKREKLTEGLWQELEMKEGAVLSAKEKVDREKERFIRILGSIGYGVASIDAKGHVISLNRVGSDITDLDPKEIRGKSYAEVFHFIDGEGNTIDPVAGALKGTLERIGKDALLVKDKSKVVPIEASASPIKNAEEDARVLGVLLIFRDVSEEREASRIKSDFVSITSHQLRTPLSSLKWNLEMLYTGEAGKVSAEQKELLFDAYESSKQMVGLVNDLLNVTGIDSGKTQVNPELTDLVAVIDNVVERYVSQAKDKGLTITFVKPKKKLDKVLVDQNLFNLAIDNLISNAVKYTPKGGKVTIMLEKENKDVLITVADTGIGIPPGIQRDIFKKFYRSKKAISVHPEGTGLGLFIAKNSVEMLGGKIWFESDEDKGTTFYVSLPQKPKLTEKLEPSDDLK